MVRAISGPACSHSFPRQGCHPLGRHHPPLSPACIQRSPWHTLHWHRGHPAALCQYPPLLVPAGMEKAAIRGRPCECQSPCQGKAAVRVNSTFPTCPHHPAVPAPLFPRGGFLKEGGDALCSTPPQLSITLVEVSPRPRALPGAPVPPVGATDQCCDGPGAMLQPRVPTLSSGGFSSCTDTGFSGTGFTLGSAGAVGGVFFIGLGRTRT